MLFTLATNFCQVHIKNKALVDRRQKTYMKFGGKTNLNVAALKPEIDEQV
jgi:hypothetical protein